MKKQNYITRRELIVGGAIFIGAITTKSANVFEVDAQKIQNLGGKTMANYEVSIYLKNGGIAKFKWSSGIDNIVSIIEREYLQTDKDFKILTPTARISLKNENIAGYSIVEVT
jgi:hypothetical protein